MIPRGLSNQPQVHSVAHLHLPPLQGNSALPVPLWIFSPKKVLGTLKAFQALCGEGIAVGLCTGWLEGLLVPPTVRGSPSICSPFHTVICGFRELECSVHILSHLDVDLERALLVAFPILGPGTSPSSVIDSPLNKQSGAVIPSGCLPLGDSISLSGWKIFRSYFVPKGWPLPTPSPLVTP